MFGWMKTFVWEQLDCVKTKHVLIFSVIGEEFESLKINIIDK